VRLRLTDPRMCRLFDTADICPTVLKSFFCRAALGQYDLDSPEQLVKLLVTMTRNKIASLARKQRIRAADQRRSDPSALENDGYALGVILYEMLTGQASFHGESALQVLEQVEGQEPLPPRRLQPKTPRNLETICLKGLQKEPGRRYATAAALAEDLRRFRAGEPIVAQPVGTLERTGRWWLRNPRWAAMLLVVAGLLLVIAGGASALSLRLNRALQHAERANRERQVKLFDTYLEKARALRNSRRIGQCYGALQTIEQATTLARELGLPLQRFQELRTEAIAALALTDLRMVREWKGNPEGTLALDFDGPLERYARVGPDGNVSLRRIADDVELFLGPGFGQESAKSFLQLLFSPDGNYLLLWAAPGLSRLWKLDTGGPILLRQDATGPVLSHTFSLDSRRLAFSHADGTIEVVELLSEATRQLRPVSESRAIPYKGLALHPDGQHLALATRAGGRPVVQLRELDGNQVLATLTGYRQAQRLAHDDFPKGGPAHRSEQFGLGVYHRTGAEPPHAGGGRAGWARRNAGRVECRLPQYAGYCLL
jgi:hypothetical protein